MALCNIDKRFEERVNIIVDIICGILNCFNEQAINIVVKSNVYKQLKLNNYRTLYDSPQANLSNIGQELRDMEHPLGLEITDENIKKIMLKFRDKLIDKQLC